MQDEARTAPREADLKMSYAETMQPSRPTEVLFSTVQKTSNWCSESLDRSSWRRRPHTPARH